MRSTYHLHPTLPHPTGLPRREKNSWDLNPGQYFKTLRAWVVYSIHMILIILRRKWITLNCQNGNWVLQILFPCIQILLFHLSSACIFPWLIKIFWLDWHLGLAVRLCLRFPPTPPHSLVKHLRWNWHELFWGKIGGQYPEVVLNFPW